MGRADAVGVLLTERLSYAFSDPFAIEFLTGLSEVVEEHGISIVLMPLARRAAGSSPAEADESDVTAVRHANIDALTILSLPADHPAAMLARARGIRLVTTSASNDPESSWCLDDRAGAWSEPLPTGPEIWLSLFSPPTASAPARLTQPRSALLTTRPVSPVPAKSHPQGRSDRSVGHNSLESVQVPFVGLLSVMS